MQTATAMKRASIRPHFSMAITLIYDEDEPDVAAIDVASRVAGARPENADDLAASRSAIIYTPGSVVVQTVAWDPPCDFFPTGKVTT